jgi:hypothetical protein
LRLARMEQFHYLNLLLVVPVVLLRVFQRGRWG